MSAAVTLAPFVVLPQGGQRQRFAALCASTRLGGQLFPDVAHNVALTTETLAAWGITNATITANAVASPRGVASAAASLLETAATGVHETFVLRSSAGAAEDWCFSVWVRANGRTAVRLGIGSTTGFAAVNEADFDLSALTAAMVGTDQSIVGFGIEDAGGGWRRCWIAARQTCQAARVRLLSGGATSYAGSTSAGVFIWGAQLERATAPRDYIPVDRVEAFAPSVPQNHMLHAFDLDATGTWAQTNVTVTADSTVAPDGTTSADTLLETTATGTHLLTYSLPAGANGEHCFAIYARGVLGSRDIVLRLDDSTSGDMVEAAFKIATSDLGSRVKSTAVAVAGALISASVDYLPDEWVRCILSARRTGGGPFNRAFVQLEQTNGTRSYAGSTTFGAVVWGAELTYGRAPRSGWPLAPLPSAALRDNGVRVVMDRELSQCLAADRKLETGKSYYWEVTFVAGTGVARVGLVRALASTALGDAASQWGWDSATGNVLNGTVTVGTAATFAAGDTVGIVAQWDVVNVRWLVYCLKNPSGPITLGAATLDSADGVNGTIFPAVGRTSAAGSVTLDVNFGQRPFKGAPPAGVLPGVFWPAVDGHRVFGTVGRMVRTLTTGDNRFRHCAARLANNPTVRRAVTCWPWGRSDRQAQIGSIELSNVDGRLADLAATDNRDRTVELHVANAEAFPFVSADSGTRVGVATLDGASSARGRVTLIAREWADRLAVPLQSITFPDTTPNTAVRGKPRPIALGNVRWAPVVMRDGPNLDFDVHDSASFLAIDEVRQNGALLATPADYSVPGAGGAFGFRRATAVQGKQCVRIRGQTKAGPALIERLPDVLTWICVTKTARLAAADLDTAGTIAALDTAAPYTLARYVGPDEVLIARDLVREVMDAFCGDVYTDRDGKVRAWRLEAPVGTPDYRFTEADLLGDVARRPDDAPGLTTTIGFAVNYCVHSTGEIAGAVQPTTIGSELSLPYQSRTATVSVASAYSQAVAAPAFVSLLTDGTQAQTEINRVAGLYAVPRAFYEIEVMSDSATAWQINPGQLVWLTVPDLDLADGKLLRVIAVEHAVAGNAVKLELWG